VDAKRSCWHAWNVPGGVLFCNVSRQTVCTGSMLTPMVDCCIGLRLTVRERGRRHRDCAGEA
jgi:hypothetical protein